MIFALRETENCEAEAIHWRFFDQSNKCSDLELNLNGKRYITTNRNSNCNRKPPKSYFQINCCFFYWTWVLLTKKNFIWSIRSDKFFACQQNRNVFVLISSFKKKYSSWKCILLLCSCFLCLSNRNLTSNSAYNYIHRIFFKNSPSIDNRMKEIFLKRSIR